MLPFSLPGFEIHQVGSALAGLSITATASSPTSICPACQHVSQRVHSYYIRSPQDLPVSGQPVQLILRVRRFRCQNRSCTQQTFVERLPEVVPLYARRTKRLLTLHPVFASASGGQTGERLLQPPGMGESRRDAVTRRQKSRLADQVRMSRSTVRDFVYAGAFPERASTLRAKSLLDPYIPYLEKRLAQGCRNANNLWGEIQAQGFTGGDKLVKRWLEPRREKPGRKHSLREKDVSGLTAQEEAGTSSERASVQLTEQTQQRATEIALEAPRHLVCLLIRNASELNELEQRTLSFLREQRTIEDLYSLVQSYFKLMRERDAEAFDPWIQKCLACRIPDLGTFAQGLQRDYAAIKAALTLPYRNGPVEGQINKLKFVKRSMDGRGRFNLLRQPVLMAS